MKCNPKSQNDHARQDAREVLRALDQIRGQTAQFGAYEGNPVNRARDERDAKVEDMWRDWQKRFS